MNVDEIIEFVVPLTVSNLTNLFVKRYVQPLRHQNIVAQISNAFKEGNDLSLRITNLLYP